jgi:hypothetical protein
MPTILRLLCCLILSASLVYTAQRETIKQGGTSGRSLTSGAKGPVAKELNVRGTALAGIAYAFDGQLRDPITPNIGADEFVVTVSMVRRVPSEYTSIQAAIDSSSNGDTVMVSDGTYYENIRFRGKKIVVASTYLTTGDTSHISQTIIDGSRATNADSASVVYFISGEDTNSVLCGFTVRGGKGTVAPPVRIGGGVLCMSGARLVRNIITGNTITSENPWGGGVDGESGQILIVEQNIVTGNSLSGTWAGGAGVQVYNMKALIRNNTIVDNTINAQGAASGCFGAGVYSELGTCTVVGNLIARNRALALTSTQKWGYGGGVFVGNGVLEFRNNRVTDNLIQTSSSVWAVGGGIALWADAVSNMTLSGNYIGGNRALGGNNTFGGGIGTRNVKLRLENNIIEKNTSVSGGGIGIEGSLSSSPAILVNNTIWDNQATQGGGALFRDGTSAVMFNNIFWADTAQSQAEILVTGATVEVQYCDVQGGYAGTGNIALAPLFVVGDSMFNLTSGSPCIGRGKDSISVAGIWYHAPTTDYDGHPRHRPDGEQPSDIGAQEEQVIVDVADGQPSVPTRFALEQNYPNPFNPKTVVSSQLPVASNVKLVVYDLLGREVAVLVDERRAAGYYHDTFDGSGLASGVYLYRLTTGSFVQSRKMLLLK